MAEESKAVRILVTGERRNFGARAPSQMPDGRRIEWVEIPVLTFEKIPVEPSKLEELLSKAPDWVIFSSGHGVEFFSQVLLDAGMELPFQTQVACIGTETARVAADSGFNPDFYPVEPGSEGFLSEFEAMISNTSTKPNILIIAAENGRKMVRDKLVRLECKVEELVVYRTAARKDLKLTPEKLAKFDLILFTSPSSAEAVLEQCQLPDAVRVGAIGAFTSEYLSKKGIRDFAVLPDSDFSRVGEILGEI